MKKSPVFLLVAVIAAALAVGLAACGGGGSSSSSSESSSTSGGSGSTEESASTGEGTEGGTIKAAWTNFPEYLDPAISYEAQGWTAMRPVYIPMLYYKAAEEEEGSEIVPGLAKELPKISNGGKTYTMFLTPGLKYSNGEEIKAGDFKYAIERLFLTNSGGSPFYTSIVGAEQFSKTKKGGISGIKVNEKTGEIVVNLTKPRGTFENEIALMFAAPIPQSTPGEDQSANPVPASGPYMISESQPGRGWTYEKNPYWEKVNAKLLPEVPSGHVDKIEVQVLRNESTQVNDIESGALDFVYNPPTPDRYQEVKEKYEGTQFRPELTVSTYYFFMNQDMKPFSNKKVREAVNYALDVRALERIYVGQIEPTQQILPPGMPGYKKYELYPHDMKKAEELIAESGEKGADVTVYAPSVAPNKEATEYYEGLLKELGFNTTLKVVNADQYFPVVGNENTPNLQTGWIDWLEDYPHPNDFFGILLAGEAILPTNNQNVSRTDYKPLNEKIAKLAEEQLGPQQETEYAELDEEFMKEAVWAPYGTRTLSVFVSDRINLDSVIWNPTFETELTSLELKE